MWIAFKNYYLRDEGQRCNSIVIFLQSCELLSKIIIFVMKDNMEKRVPELLLVVNCFQKLLSSWWRTTEFEPTTAQDVLWIAFKNYYLRDEGQLFLLISSELFRCELLSKIIIFVMKDNFPLKNASWPRVVNCFQKLLSSWWRTTLFLWLSLYPLLWIAFKNYYLRDEGQPSGSSEEHFYRCELLSKIIIFVMKDNQWDSCQNR